MNATQILLHAICLNSHFPHATLEVNSTTSLHKIMMSWTDYEMKRRSVLQKRLQMMSDNGQPNLSGKEWHSLPAWWKAYSNTLTAQTVQTAKKPAEKSRKKGWRTVEEKRRSVKEKVTLYAVGCTACCLATWCLMKSFMYEKRWRGRHHCWQHLNKRQ